MPLALSVSLRGGRLLVLPGPVRGGVAEPCVVEEFLVEEQQHVGEVLGQAELLAVLGECLQGRRGVRCGVILRVGLRRTSQVEQRAGRRVGHRVLVVHLERVRHVATRDAGLELGEVVGVGRRLHLDRDVRVLRLEALDDRVEILEVVRGSTEREVPNSDRCSGPFTGRRSAGRAWAAGTEQQGQACRDTEGAHCGALGHLPPRMGWCRPRPSRATSVLTGPRFG